MHHHQGNSSNNAFLHRRRSSTTPVHSNQFLNSGYSDDARKTSQFSQLTDCTSCDGIRQWFIENLRNYCRTTSLHGFNNIVNKSNTPCERYFWIVIVIISIIACIVLVTLSYIWNSETPTVTVIESSHFATWNVRFPAATICNFNKISKKRATALEHRLALPPNITKQDLYKLFESTRFFSFGLNYTDAQIARFEQILALNSISFLNVSEALRPDCMNMIARCIWKGITTRCESLFQRVLTMEGSCCTFNYFGRNLNNFAPKIAYQVPKRPYRVTGCGYPTGLSALLNPDTDDYLGTYISSYGFRLYIHDSYDYPDENAETKILSSTRESFVRINPEATYATNDVKTMKLSMRNCLFSNERRLSAMQRYSFVNCMTECRMQILFKTCGCIPEFLPHNNSYPICGLRQINCIVANKRVFTRAMPETKDAFSAAKDSSTFPCDCLPDCEIIQYTSEITTGRLNVNFNFHKIISNNSRHDKDTILLHIFYSDLLSTRYRMEVFQNWLSALASFGGLLGLLMGFSIVTGFEFLYFLTFRPVFNYLADR